MAENRNMPLGLCGDGRGTVCIDTRRVLDCCRDRDCFENTRVYLSALGEQALTGASGIRTRSAKVLWAYVGVDPVPFNRGFYQVTIRYYVEVECEICLGIGKSQSFIGLAVLEKEVILYGGEGSITSYASSAENNYCAIGNLDTVSNNAPVAIVDTVEPIILGSKVVECPPACNEFVEIPEAIRQQLDGDPVMNGTGPRLYVSFGLFSVIRIERPTQLLIQATDYSVPDKECVAATNDDDPCSLFRTMAFPVGQFRAGGCAEEGPRPRPGGCGCSGNGGSGGGGAPRG